MKPYLLIALFALACSPEKRLNRFLERHPEFARRDTITVVDTAYFDRVEQHVVEVLIPGDTLRIDTGRLHVRVVKLPGERVYVQGVCDADTVVVTKDVIVDRVLPTKTVHRLAWWQWLLLALVLSVAFILGQRLSRRP